MDNKIIMQGDIQLEPCEEPKNIQKVFIGTKYILKHGENGNKHTLSVKNKTSEIEVYKNKEGSIFVRIKGVGILTHKQHGTHIITPQWYRYNDEQEFDYFENQTRNIID